MLATQKYIRSVSKSNSIPPTLHHNSISADTDSEKVNTFNGYFYSAFTQPPSYHLPPSHSATVPTSITITEEDVYNALIELELLAPADHIPPIVLSKCMCTLHHLFSLTLKYGYLLIAWKIHKIISYLSLVILPWLITIGPSPYLVTHLKYLRE